MGKTFSDLSEADQNRFGYSVAAAIELLARAADIEMPSYAFAVASEDRVWTRARYNSALECAVLSARTHELSGQLAQRLADAGVIATVERVD